MSVPYPEHEASDVVLRDGSTIHLRPIRPDDGPRLLGLYQKLSEASLYFRFFVVPAPDRLKAEYLAHVDYENQFALVAESGDEIVAVGRFYRMPQAPDRAEVAFTIADSLHGHGMGTRLLERLAEIALARGIRWFEADVLQANQKMMDVFLGSGLETRHRLESGVFHVEVSLGRTADFERKAAERAQKAASASMKVFFEPRSVAVVGAGRKRGQIGAEIFFNLKDGGYTGRLVAVNPNAAEIDGIPCFPRLVDVPDEVDLAVIAVPAPHVESVVDDAIAKGVRGLVVITAGFGELGAEGRAREARIVEKIRSAGVRMIGPNCMGVVNTDPAVALNATFTSVRPPEGRVAMSTQSGALGLAILGYARQLNIGFSTFVSVGNKADVSGNDLIQYWAEDPRTSVILLYLESFGNPRKFTQLARRIARDKPIVAVKSGRSAAGARAASSHTGALASSDRVVDALFRQAGIIRTDTLQELFDVATLLAHQPAPKGRRVAILTNAGGPGILAADACEAKGLELPALTEKTVAALKALLPPEASVANPVDMLASADAAQYERAMRLLLADDRVDSLVVIFIPPLESDAPAVAAAIQRGAEAASGKPVLATFLNAQGAPSTLAPVPCFPFPESAATALARVTRYGEWKLRPAGTIPRFPDLRSDQARAVVERALARGGGWLTPSEAQDLLSHAGIDMARSRLATGASEAMAAAKEIGFPVALKAVGPRILHKTEVGGVKLSLYSTHAVHRAYDELKERLRGDLQAVLVQQMIEGGAEMMVGTLQDPVFGPLVVYGSGGTMVELLSDVAFRIHPLTESDVDEMLLEVKGTALLRGFRGSRPSDERALRDVLLRLSALLDVCPEIQEMDVNPVKVLERGARAVDARVRVGPPLPRAVSRRVMY